MSEESVLKWEDRPTMENLEKEGSSVLPLLEKKFSKKNWNKVKKAKGKIYYEILPNGTYVPIPDEYFQKLIIQARKDNFMSEEELSSLEEELSSAKEESSKGATGSIERLVFDYSFFKDKLVRGALIAYYYEIASKIKTNFALIKDICESEENLSDSVQLAVLQLLHIINIYFIWCEQLEQLFDKNENKI